MSSARSAVMDGNTAAAHIAYRVNEVCAIFPITPSSAMAELADAWTAEGVTNIWGNIPVVMQMQSEGGAAGTLHGSLQSGALTTTFTASQGLLLMLPNMYKIAGELTPCVFHVAARALATQALSIFGDHSDVMSARMTGFAMLAAASVQEAHDLALVSQAVTLESRVPIMYFFDGFRTSHEENKISIIPDEQIRLMIDDELVRAFRARALSPEHPVVRGTAHNPDTFFQARETVNPFYERFPAIVQKTMDRLAALTGRSYTLFRYFGDPQAERVVVAIGSACEVLDETAAYLNARGEKLGVLQVTLYRPWDAQAFLAALPRSVKAIAVLDRTKEVGACDPLYTDVLTTLAHALAAGSWPAMPRMIAGRYGISSKDFDPSMAKAVFDELTKPEPKQRFTIGIDDDVSHSSLVFDPEFSIEPPDVVRALFFGLGADGTIGANKNSVKILAADPQSVCAGLLRIRLEEVRVVHDLAPPLRIATRARAVSAQVGELRRRAQVRFSLQAGRAHARCARRDRAAQQSLRPRARVDRAAEPRSAADPRQGPEALRDRCLERRFTSGTGLAQQHRVADVLLHAVGRVAARAGDCGNQERDGAHLRAQRGRGRAQELRGDRQRAREPASGHARSAGYGAAGVRRPRAGQRSGVRAQRDDRHDGRIRRNASRQRDAGRRHVPHGHDEVRETQHRRRSADLGTGSLHPVRPMLDRLPAQRDPREVLRQHAARKRAARRSRPSPSTRAATPNRATRFRFTSRTARAAASASRTVPAHAPHDASIKAINMRSRLQHLDEERTSIGFFETLPWPDRTRVNFSNVRGVQFMEPLFEFPGACAGCGETPYLKLLSQLFGDRLQIANATGCSSIYGGNLPTTPWASNAEGRGPAWANSLFEDNAEFGLGYRIAVDKQMELACTATLRLAPRLGEDLGTRTPLGAAAHRVGLPSPARAGFGAQVEAFLDAG